MKKSSKHIWLSILGVAAAATAGVWGYETFMVATTLAPGAMSVPVPKYGMAAHFALPSGAQKWGTASYVSLIGGTAISLTVPGSTMRHLAVPKPLAGGILTVQWVDSTGTIQTSVATFTAAA